MLPTKEPNDLYKKHIYWSRSKKRKRKKNHIYWSTLPRREQNANIQTIYRELAHVHSQNNELFLDVRANHECQKNTKQNGLTF